MSTTDQHQPRALPVTDAEIDADPEVAALEEAIADGQDVTVEELGEVRAAAATRSRMSRLLGARADRKVRADAEKLERDQAAAAEAHARTALAPYTPAALVPVYDEAVRALTAYTDALKTRNGVVRTLATLPADQRPRTAEHNPSFPNSARLALDGHLFTEQSIAQHLERLFGAAGLARNGTRYVPADTSPYTADDRDPEIIAEGRTA